MTWAAIGATVVTTAVGAATAKGGADAAQGAAGLQKEYLDLGINEIRNALGPSMMRLAKAQGWSDDYLRKIYQGAMAGTQPYRQAGERGLGRLNYLLGTDNGLGPQPTAPTAPKPPKYSKDPATAAAQKKQYKKDLRAYEHARTYYDQASATWKTQTDAAASDPEFGSLMKPYTDRFEAPINDVAKRQYVDKYGQEILDTARDKFDAADFVADPGYEFRRSEGNRGIEQSAAAHGSLQSGAALKELTRFNQDTASNEFDRAYGRWGDQRNTKLGALTGQQGFDYGVFDKQKGTEVNSLVDQRNFDFGNFDNNRKFQYGALTGMVDTGQQATDDQNQLREYFGTARTQNAIANAVQQGNWQQGTAGNIANFLASQGNAQAAGQINAANAQTNAWQTGANALTTLAGYYYGNGRRGQGLVHRTPTA